MVDFDRLNRETREYNSKNIDRFNPSTRSNYSSHNFDRLNNETYKHNNGQYSPYYNK